MPKILFSTSINAVDKDLVGDLSLGWRSRQGELSDLIDCVKRGHPINAAIFNSAKRLDSNFVEANLVILDIDNGKKVDGQKIYDPKLSIEEAIAHPFVKAHCLYSYTSSSHSPDWHKFRLILLLSEPVANIEVYKRIIRLVAQSVNGCDRAAMSATNIFFGNTNAQDLIVNPDATPIDVGAIYELFAEQDTQSEQARLERQKTRNLQSENDRTPVEWARYYLSFIDPSRANQYNHWIAVGMTLKSISEELFTDWCNWSSQQGSYKGEVDCWMHWRGASFANKTPEEAIAKLGAWSKQDGRETKPRREKVAVKEKDGARSQKESQPNGDELPTEKLESSPAANWQRRIAKMSEIEQECGFLTSRYFSQIEDFAKEEKLASKTLQNIYNTFLSEEDEEEDRTIAEMVATAPEDVPWLVPNLVVEGTTLLFHARSGCGKTLLVYNLLKALGEGTAFLGQEVTRKTKCGLIQIDEPPRALIARSKELGLDKVDIQVKTRWSFGQLHKLPYWINKHALKFVVLDSFFAGQKYSATSENDADHAAVLMRLRDIAAATNCTILIVHHSNKKDEARGSDAIVGAVSDTWHLCKPDPEKHGNYKLKPNERIFECEKTRFSDQLFKLAIALNGDDLIWANLGDLSKIDDGTANEPASLKDKIRLYLESATQPFTVSDLLADRTMLGLERGNARKILADLRKTGFVFSEPTATETKWISLLARKLQILEKPSNASNAEAEIIDTTSFEGVTDPVTDPVTGALLGNSVAVQLSAVSNARSNAGYAPPVTLPVTPSNKGLESDTAKLYHEKKQEIAQNKNAIADRLVESARQKATEPAPHKPSRPYGGPPVGATVQFKDRGLTPAYRRKLIETATDYPWGAVGHVDTIVKNTNRHEIIVSVGDKTYLVDNFLAIETLELPDEYLSPPESEDAWYVNEDYDQGELL